MSPINNFEAMCHYNELIYHKAPYTIKTFNNTPYTIETFKNTPYTIETFNNASPIYHNLSYNHKQLVAADDVSNNLGAEVMTFIKVFIFNMLLPFLLSIIFFL